MKYKNLKSMAHNFSHSFVSATNYVDGDFVANDLRAIARKSPGKVHSITWIPFNQTEIEHFPERVQKSINNYVNSLLSHLKSHHVEVKHICKLRTEFCMKQNGEFVFSAVVEDDRGKFYESPVEPGA